MDEQATDRAKLAQLADWNEMAVWFDGGPELLSHQQMHKHHAKPYIGCLFCRDQFMPIDRARMIEIVESQLPLNRAAELTCYTGSNREARRLWALSIVDALINHESS